MSTDDERHELQQAKARLDGGLERSRQMVSIARATLANLAGRVPAADLAVLSGAVDRYDALGRHIRDEYSAVLAEIRD